MRLTPNSCFVSLLKMLIRQNVVADCAFASTHASFLDVSYYF